MYAAMPNGNGYCKEPKQKPKQSNTSDRNHCAPRTSKNSRIKKKNDQQPE